MMKNTNYLKEELISGKDTKARLTVQFDN